MVAAVQPGISRATIPRWAAPFLYPARYKSAAGGRGAGRTHTFSELCVLRMDGKLPAYEPGPVTIAAARQFQNSISESCKRAMEFYIRKLGLSDHFAVHNYSIDNKVTGSHCFFPGFNRNPQSLMSAEGVDILWIEQSETVEQETMKGHVEADERVDALHHEADSDTEEGMEFRVKGFSPRALRQDFTIEALLSRLWKARRTMAVANSDASSLLGGWSFRKDNSSSAQRTERLFLCVGQGNQPKSNLSKGAHCATKRHYSDHLCRIS